MAGGGSDCVLGCRRCVLAEGLLTGEGAVDGAEQTVKHEGRWKIDRIFTEALCRQD